MLTQPDVTLLPNARRGEPEGRWASPWTVVSPRQFANFNNAFLLRARPKAERVFAEYENFLKLSDPTDRP